MIAKDIKYSARALIKAPAMTLTAIIALALGIGANTALFTVINAVLLRPLSYPHPERIVELMRHFPGFETWSTTPTKFAFWRNNNQSLEAVAAYSFQPMGLNLAQKADARRLAAEAASADYFRALGVQPLFGRTYSAQEDQPGAGHYAVLSYALWQNLFHSDRNIAGKTLRLSNADYEVIGVMPPTFDTPQHADLYVPLQLTIDPSDLANDYSVIARLKPNMSPAMAQQDMNLVAQRFRKVYGKDLIGDQESIGVVPYHDYLVSEAKGPLWILLTAVGFVLLVACANVANLLLARSAIRQREMAVRAAVGASASQLIRQMLNESLLLSLAGAAAGCLMANGFLPLLIHLAPSDIPQLTGATLDLKVLVCTLAVAVATGVLFGLFPAIQSARLGIAKPLREAASRTTTSATSNRVRQALVIAEVAVSLMLLIGAVLLIKTIGNLEAVQPGFDSHHVLTMQMSLDNRFQTSTSVAQFCNRVTARLQSTPGVVSVATTGLLPMNPYFDLPFEIIGHPTKRDDMPDEKYRLVSPKYFATLHVPVIAGREFSERDTAQSQPVVAVNAAFAAKYFPKQDPLDQQILIGRIMGPNFVDKPRRIVGVVGDIRDDGLNRPAPPEMFEPEAQVPDALTRLDLQFVPLNWVIRTSENPLAMSERIRRETLAVSGGIPMAEPKLLEDILSSSLDRQRFVMTLLTVFAGIALLLGTVGLYGVISYSVAQRTREMGIRSTLGAQRQDLLRLVVGEGMRLATAGFALGLAGAFALTRFLQSMLYGISPSDPLVLAGVTLLMGAIALLASFVPAYRASHIDPLVALREE